MHVKDFSLLTDRDGTSRLSPTCDTISRPVFVADDDSRAIMMGTRQDKFTCRKWIDFAEYCGIPKKAAQSLVTAQIEALEPAIQLIQNSVLPEKKKGEYETIIRANTSVLKGETPTPSEEEPSDTPTT